jgi:acetyl esterase/lipase
VCIRGEPSVSGDRPIGSYQEENMPGSRSLIDDELAEALKAVLMNRKRLFDLTDIPAARKAQRSFAESVAATLPDDPSVTVRELRVPRAGGPAVPVRLLRPVDAPGPLPVMVWFHGGGQVVGFAAQDDPRLTRMCLALGCAIASVDYRLAPETPAPGAAEDGYTAYQFITREAGALGLDRTRTGLAGVSGGGAIAAATALLIRDRGAAAPLFQSLTFPMLDDRNATRSSREITDIGIWDRETNILAWRAVLGDRAGADDVSPYCAAARASDLAGLPPTFIAAGELDVFRDEDLDYAARLRACGVPVELHIYPGAYHSFNVFAPSSRLAASFDHTWLSYLARRFATA